MFSRYRHAPAAAVLLVCLSVMIISAVSVSEMSYAKGGVALTFNCGDPDEFETRISGPQSGGGSKVPLSSDSSLSTPNPAPLKTPTEEVKQASKVLPFDNGRLAKALKRLIFFVVVELDVR